MSPHTPEPWKWRAQGDANEYCLLTDDGRCLISFRQNGELTDERQKANARRMAACVNACAGFPLHLLEGNVGGLLKLGIEQEKEITQLEKQRDALLAALKRIKTDKDGDGFIAREAMEQVREAIAQTGGTGL